VTAFRALTIRQPWADAITYGPKRVENRTWKLPAKHEGARILIHAAAQADRPADDFDPGGPYGQMFLRLRSKIGQRGAVVAIATITGCHWSDDGTCCGPWGFDRAYHWTLDDVTALAQPVPAKGRLRIWTPDPQLVVAVTEAAARPVS
jgi:hypothetical protein